MAHKFKVGDYVVIHDDLDKYHESIYFTKGKYYIVLDILYVAHERITIVDDTNTRQNWNADSFKLLDKKKMFIEALKII